MQPIHKAAMPLLKKVEHMNPAHFTTVVFDAGYDYKLIYEQATKQQMCVVIPYNTRREGEYIGFDEYFRPTCVLEHSYCYDSFNLHYRTSDMSFTRGFLVSKSIQN